MDVFQYFMTYSLEKIIKEHYGLKFLFNFHY